MSCGDLKVFEAVYLSTSNTLATFERRIRSQVWRATLLLCFTLPEVGVGRGEVCLCSYTHTSSNMKCERTQAQYDCSKLPYTLRCYGSSMTLEHIHRDWWGWKQSPMHSICGSSRLLSSGCPRRFIIFGIDGPYTSASSRPTARPPFSLDKEMARFTVDKRIWATTKLASSTAWGTHAQSRVHPLDWMIL